MANIVDRPSYIYLRPQEGASTAVGDRIDMLNGLTQTAYDMTLRHIDSVTTLASSLETQDTSDINVDSPELIGADYPLAPDLPDRHDVGISEIWPEKPEGGLTLSDVSSLEVPDFPAFNLEAPTFNDPGTPKIEQITAPGDVPTIEQVDVPTAPSISLPEPPSFDEILMPAAPSITLPEFDEEAPAFELDDPAYFSWGEPTYTSDIWSSLLAKVIYNIENGGTGLEASVESDIYNRHLERVTDEIAKAQYDIENYFAARGFELPPGALAGALAELQQQTIRSNAEVSRDIAINQAELAQKNTHFIYEMGAKLESMLRDFFTHQANRSLTAAQTVAENAVAVYNAKADNIRLQLDAYKTKAAVYESRVRAALTAIEVFKAQVESAKVQADLQQNLVSIYTAQVGAAETYMQLYVSEMQGAKIKSELEMAKLAVYRSETEAYTARLQGERAKVDLYEAQLQGESTKADVYYRQVQAYRAEVEAKAQELSAQVSQLQADLEKNRVKLEEYKTEYSAYETETRAKAAEISAYLSGYQADVSAYTAKVGAQDSYHKSMLNEQQLKLSEAQFNMQKAVAEIEAAVSGYTKIKELQINANSNTANIGAQLTASAMNAINANLSFSSSISRGASVTGNYSESLSESHTYDYE